MSVVIITSPMGVVAEYGDEYVCVCVSVSGTTRAIFTNFLCMLIMAVALSSSSLVAIRYVLRFCGLTSCFFL